MTNDEMRELDAWIAENVMGWRAVHDSDETQWYDADSFTGWFKSARDPVQIYAPTTDPAAALEVVERMRLRGWYARLENETDGQWSCTFTANDVLHIHASGVRLPLAICLAARKAVEGTMAAQGRRNEQRTRDIDGVDGDR